MKKEIIKPFDLEAYKNGAKVKTRDGREVRIICTDAKGLYPIVALVSLDAGDEVIQPYSPKGMVRLFTGMTCSGDLVIVEEVEEPEFWSDRKSKNIEGYVISKDCSKKYYLNNVMVDNCGLFATQKQAKSARAMARISQIMANDVENFGGAITDEEWGNDDWKHVLYRYDDTIWRMVSRHEYKFLAFHTEAQRDLFLEKYPNLVREYLMID